jgi:methyl-accepting chemotaxis protein
MKIKYKLSLLVIIIMIVAIGTVAIILLRQATAISIDLSVRNLKSQTNQRAQFWKGREDGILQMLRGVASIMGDYEDIPVNERRDRFDDFLRITLVNNTNMVRIFSIWKPNAMDGMDDRYIGRTGSTATGQYAMTWGRDTGPVIPTPNLVADQVTAWLNGPNARKDRIEHPTPFKVLGNDTFIFRFGVPIINSRTNEVVGNITCLISIDAMQEVLTNTLNSLEEIYAISIYSGDGTILASYRPERVGQKLIDVDTLYGTYIQQVNQAVLDGKDFACHSYAPLLKEWLYIEMTPIVIGNSDTTWTVMMGSADSFMLKEVNAITRFTIILAIISVAVAALIIYFVLSGITSPISVIANVLKSVAQGDLTKSANINSTDEIGQLAHDFDATVEAIRYLIGIVKKEAAGLAGIGNSLASNMTETAAAINEITANIRNIKGRVISQSASVTETNATMEQVIVNINKLNNHVESQGRDVAQASSAIEEMVANINSVTNTLVSNAGNVKTLQEASEIGRGGLQEVASDIQEIARESEGLLEINAVMENIASQTNLLSMNAAIEAAHAGEAGKGFAVVADEIRKLAESSSEQSKTISNVLKKIKGSIDKITKSTENVLTRFEAIDSGVKTVAQQEGNIRNAMEEQEQGSKQVLDAVSNVSEVTRMVKGSSEEMLQGSKEVMTESQNLERVTQEITSGMNEMSSGAEQINVSVNNVNDMTGKNREAIENLIKEVSKFKVE